MADRGYRSIEVTITNQTGADLTVQGVSLGLGQHLDFWEKRRSREDRCFNTMR